MKRTAKRVAAMGCFWGLWCGTLAVSAQVPAPSAQAPAGYQELYEQAVNELATGIHERARELFAQAHELMPNAHTLRGLGVAELELGDHARAAALLERALGSSVNPLSPALRAHTEQLLQRARAAQVAPMRPATLEPAAPPPPPAPPPVQPAPVRIVEPQAPPASRPLPQAAGAPRRQGTQVAGAFYLSAIVPFEGYARETQGVGVDGGLWIQLEHLALEPRLGLRIDAEDEHRGYFHVPLELGAYVLGNLGEHALFVGPGVGLHAIFERVDVEHTVGTAIRASSRDTLEDDAFGFGVFARAGAVLLRTRVASVVPCVDYAITFADFTHGSYEHALRINVGVLIGGGR